MWEQLMQMLGGMPTQGVMPPGAEAVGAPGATLTPQIPAMSAPPLAPPAWTTQLAQVGKDFSKGMGPVSGTPAAQGAAPPPPKPAPYNPNSGGLGTGGGGDPMQMLMMLPGMAQMLGGGAGGQAPDNMGNMGNAPGAMPSLGELMQMGRR